MLIALYYLEKNQKRKKALIEQIETEDLPKISLNVIQNNQISEIETEQSDE